MGVTAVFTDTESFLESRAPDGVLVPGGLVLLAGLLGALHQLYLQWWLLSGAEAASTAAVAASMVVGLLVGLVVYVVAWLLATALIHGIATLYYEREATFAAALNRTSYGMLPQGIGGLLLLGALVVALQDFTVPTTLEGIESVQTDVTSHTVMRAANIAYIAFYLWSADLWVAAVRSVYGLSQKRAAIVVAAPVVALIAFHVTVLM